MADDGSKGGNAGCGRGGAYSAQSGDSLWTLREAVDTTERGRLMGELSCWLSPRCRRLEPVPPPPGQPASLLTAPVATWPGGSTSLETLASHSGFLVPSNQALSQPSHPRSCVVLTASGEFGAPDAQDRVLLHMSASCVLCSRPCTGTGKVALEELTGSKGSRRKDFSVCVEIAPLDGLGWRKLVFNPRGLCLEHSSGGLSRRVQGSGGPTSPRWGPGPDEGRHSAPAEKRWVGSGREVQRGSRKRKGPGNWGLSKPMGQLIVGGPVGKMWECPDVAAGSLLGSV